MSTPSFSLPFRDLRLDDLGRLVLTDLQGAEHRLRTFLVYRFGGPQTYLQERGHPRLRMRHMPFVVDERARDRWMSLMMAAVDEVGVAPEHRDYLETFLGDIATFLRNR